MNIQRATLRELDQLVPLFDAYRVFYQQLSDRAAALDFLKARLQGAESVIFLALGGDGAALGFTQLYPLFSSVSMEPFYVLNDLYVDPTYRDQGVGTALLEHAQQFAEVQQQKGLALETAADNPAQFLYERLGWEQNKGFLHYFWTRPNRQL